MDSFSYTAYGLHFRASLPLPELTVSNGTSVADVSIQMGDVPEELDQPAGRGVLYQANEDEFLLKLDDVARFLVHGGNKIIIDPAPDCIKGDIRVFLLGSCMGALLHQRGILALHASALQTDQGAVLFVGPSSIGKSTLLGEFLNRGYAMLADDVTGIVLDNDGRPSVLPAFPRTRLWADSVEKLGHDKEQLEQVRLGQEKYELTIPEKFCARKLPLCHVYQLTTTNKDELKLETVENIWRFAALRNNTYRVRFLDGLEMRPHHFKTVSAVARQIPVTDVVRPSYPFRLMELADMIEEDLKGGVSD